MLKKNLHNYRLLLKEREGIIQGIEAVVHQGGYSLNECKLFLYGSRTDVTRKGGDIDLMLEVPDIEFNRIQELEINFLIAIKEKIGDQKIDFLIRNQKAMMTPFEKVALKNKKLLKKW